MYNILKYLKYLIIYMLYILLYIYDDNKSYSDVLLNSMIVTGASCLYVNIISAWKPVQNGT